ncbi:HAMP domain-containing sensor histidine kinase [Pararhodospirillum photometricum]|uniref:histidine kinase n=1 Tax=Pararhodospirillum photometricum DSM 122 TaxID=1150469 RepID=H6SQY3_PARPM|nr:ATP-binding protein [Pararhodospirillum photometricum]CCG07448.1 Sensor protein [Pararhodospirillum photometricum DSM 122]
MGRLFWKLFFCFWLGMVLSFVAGVTYLLLTDYREAAHSTAGVQAGVMLATAEALVATGGVDALTPVLARWNAESPRLGVLDATTGQRLAGVVPTAPPGSRLDVTPPDGRPVVLVTDVVALSLGEHPSPVGIPVMSGAVVAFVLSYFLAWYLSHPLQKIRWALGRVAEGHFDTRVAPRLGQRRDEIVDLGHDVDRMARQLQQFVEERQRLLHDISHELRSPLTRLQAAIGLVRQDPARSGPMLERIEREAVRMDVLIDDLLTLARLEVGSFPFARERVDLIDLLSAIVDDAAFEAEAQGCAVTLNAEGNFVCTVSGEVLYRAFENIVRNAVKFTAPGTTVVVRAEALEEEGQPWLRVSVEDHGAGVPPALLGRIFEPFLRVASDSPTPGFGLGLAIARRAVESHGGRIHAELAGHGGLRVVMVLPGAPAGEK